jgi:hypothetical protein
MTQPLFQQEANMILYCSLGKEDLLNNCLLQHMLNIASRRVEPKRHLVLHLY